MILSTEFVVITCYKCGVQFAMPEAFQKHLQQTHESFWCPNGHSQLYKTQTEADRYRRMYEEEAAKAVPLREKLAAEERAHKRTKKKLKSVETRTAAGVCPCCNRTFAQLADHMKSKHQDFMVLQGMTPPKQLTGDVQK